MDVLEDWNLWNRFSYRNDFVYVPKVTSAFRVPANAKIAEKRNKILSNAYLDAVKRNEIQILFLENLDLTKDHLRSQ